MSGLREDFYAEAAPGAPDRFVVMRPTVFRWAGCPRWAWDLCHAPVSLPAGQIRRTLAADGRREIELLIHPGYHFSVTLAPDHPAATPASCPHDWICEHRAELALAWGVSVYRVRQMGDHFFMALLRHDRFSFRRTYFLCVCLWSRLSSLREPRPTPPQLLTPNSSFLSPPP